MLDNQVFMDTMKADIKALGKIGADTIESGIVPGESTMSKYLWIYKPLDDVTMSNLAKRYNMSREDFEEYTRRFKTFYIGR